MSYWMFNPCSPCCETSSCVSGYCSLPTGDLHLLIRNSDYSDEIHKYTAQPSGRTWTFRIPLSGFWENNFHGDHMTWRNTCTGTYYPLNIPICTSGTSTTLNIRLSGMDNAFDSITSVDTYQCGPKIAVDYYYEGDGICLNGSPCQGLMERPTKSYVYNEVYPSPLIYSTTGLPYVLYDDCFNISLGNPLGCKDRCTTDLLFNTNRFNCQYGNFTHSTNLVSTPVFGISGTTYLYATGLIGDYICSTGYTNCFPLGSPEASGGLYYLQAKAYRFSSYVNNQFSFNGFFTDSLTHKLKDSVGQLCNIPTGLYLQVRTFPYSGSCMGMCYSGAWGTIKTGIEINGTVALNYNINKGYWEGTGMPYNLYGNICTANNPSGWFFALETLNGASGNADGRCYGMCDGFETDTFTNIKFCPNTAKFGNYNTSGCTYTRSNSYFLVLSNEKLSLYYNLTPGNDVCSPFYFEQHSNSLGTLNSQPTFPNVKWHDQRPAFIDDTFKEVSYSYYPSEGDRFFNFAPFEGRHQNRNYVDGSNIQQLGEAGFYQYFPYYNSHGFGKEILAGFDLKTIYTCVAGTGFVIISE